jgi:hypothetical protein
MLGGHRSLEILRQNLGRFLSHLIANIVIHIPGLLDLKMSILNQVSRPKDPGILPKLT